MDTIIHFDYGFKIDGIYFGWSQGFLYQLPYTIENKYYPLRRLRKKTAKNGWEYYHVRRKKYGVEKIKAMLEAVDWQVKKPIEI